MFLRTHYIYKYIIFCIDIVVNKHFNIYIFKLIYPRKEIYLPWLSYSKIEVFLSHSTLRSNEMRILFKIMYLTLSKYSKFKIKVLYKNTINVFIYELFSFCI